MPLLPPPQPEPVGRIPRCGPLTVNGTLQALQAIVGGLLRDQRVFHMDSKDWIDLLQLQGAFSPLVFPVLRICITYAADALTAVPWAVEFELAAFGGWPTGGAETVKEESVKLLNEKGWKATRLALAATIRSVTVTTTRDRLCRRQQGSSWRSLIKCRVLTGVLRNAGRGSSGRTLRTGAGRARTSRCSTTTTPSTCSSGARRSGRTCRRPRRGTSSSGRTSARSSASG